MKAPVLVITGAGGTTGKYSTFNFKANGLITNSITGANCPSIANAQLIAPYINNAPQVAGNLVPDASSTPSTIPSCRFYTLVATINPGEPTVAPTFSWLASADFPKHTDPSTGYRASPNSALSCVVGWLFIKNESGAVFIPGTTHLDAAGITAVFTDNYAQTGN